MKVLNMITRIVILLIFGTIIYMVILKLTNHSPTADTIMVTLIVGIGGAISKLMIDFYKFEGKVTNYMKVSKNTLIKFGNKLDKIETDINELKSDMKLVNKDLNLIKHKLKIYP